MARRRSLVLLPNINNFCLIIMFSHRISSGVAYVRNAYVMRLVSYKVVINHDFAHNTHIIVDSNVA